MNLFSGIHQLVLKAVEHLVLNLLTCVEEPIRQDATRAKTTGIFEHITIDIEIVHFSFLRFRFRSHSPAKSETRAAHSFKKCANQS